MKNRMNARIGILGIVAAVLTAAVVVPLVAQPDFAPVPTKTTKPSELMVPPGVYTAFVFASEASQCTVSLKTASGSLNVIVPANDTVVIPMPANFTLGQQGVIQYSVNAGRFFASAMTTTGPVSFEPVKK